MKKLKKSELSELKGGVQTAPASGDVSNHNTVSGCSCTYTDTSVISNTNDVMSCSCTCMKKGIIISR